jgi:hypothetical protein
LKAKPGSTRWPDLYTLDAPIGAAPPVFDDVCSDSLGTGCTVGARVARFRVRPNGTSGPEQVLIEEWCQQFPSHSIGTLAFGPDGALYVGGGDGASFTFTDWGQNGNPCGDPTNEGGALRSQDLRTAGDPAGMNGSILRVDPSTGNALPDNPLIGGDPSDDRIIAYGLRNPFRFAVKPGTEDGTLLRVKGKGAPKLKGSGKGDLLARVKLSVPKKMSKKEREAVEALQKASRENPREGLVS